MIASLLATDPLVLAVALVTLAAIALYAIFGGADFGGGVLDVLASGPRRSEQQSLIGHVIGPVWETNHVWLIFAIVALFTCFPPAFAAISTGLFVPLTFVLVGIILRGAAYAFRSQAHETSSFGRVWGHVFGIASAIAPFFFGAAVGGLTVGGYRWSSPFAIVIGIFALALCTQIAAVFLTLETDGDVRADFHKRAMVATFVLAAVGAVALALAAATERETFQALIAPQSRPGVAIAMTVGFIVLGTLAGRRFALARIAVAVEAVAILAGWYLSQAPFLVPHEITVVDAASPHAVLRAFLWLVGIGAALLVPSLVLLFRTFKNAPTTPTSSDALTSQL
ncbi:MAG: cytochrome d ubiquinol oxidase subunit II [Vulcanimicrobiaceae bacterium]